VHLLPAPIFRMTADLQARRRLGLTATLVREDGREGDVFSLIGPKRYDAPWKDIESQGYIAPADCVEVRVTLTESERLAYAVAEPEERYRFASSTPSKTRSCERSSSAPRRPGAGDRPVHRPARRPRRALDAPVIKGETTVKERERLFQAFRSGEISLLVVSKVANFSIDLPEAAVAIQVSGTFGSRQEEAQRLGRILRPKADGRTARSTPSPRGTPSTRTSPRTGSGSSPSRATPTGSSTPTTCPPSTPAERRFRSVEYHPLAARGVARTRSGAHRPDDPVRYTLRQASGVGRVNTADPAALPPRLSTAPQWGGRGPRRRSPDRPRRCAGLPVGGIRLRAGRRQGRGAHDSDGNEQ
jgi:hypothetical protein